MGLRMSKMGEQRAKEELIINLKTLAQFDDHQFGAVLSCLEGVSISELRNKKKFEKFIAEAGLSPSLISDAFPAILSVMFTAKKTNSDPGTIIHDLGDDILDKKEIKRIISLFKKNLPQLSSLLARLESNIVPSSLLNIGEYAGIQISIINIAQFTDDYEEDDMDPDQYNANIRKFFTRAILSISNSHRDTFTCYADIDGIDNLIRLLLVAKKQLDAVEIHK